MGVLVQFPVRAKVEQPAGSVVGSGGEGVSVGEEPDSCTSKGVSGLDWAGTRGEGGAARCLSTY